jgi:tetratricopeptide (TPR) repeat protein
MTRSGGIRATITAIVVPAILLGWQLHAAAQPAQKDLTICQRSKPQDTIQNCGALLDTKIYGGEALAEIYYSRGVAYSALEKYEEAIADYSRMLALLPRKAIGWARRGEAYAKLKRDELALADVNKAIEMKFANPAIFHLRGCLLVALGRYGAAIEDFDKVLALQPAATSWKYRALALAGLGKYDLTIVDLDKALALKPKDAAELAALRCGTRAMIKEQMNEALAECLKNLRANPKSVDNLDSVSFVYFRMGKFDEARKYNERAMVIKPESPGLIFMRGAIKREHGDTLGGNADMMAATAKDSDLAKFYAIYGIKD